ncbi:MAG: hypothetical protein F7C35_08735 [Desulfurococcales archaeon]|nr:hypothetical protein [Desulfurococcales archaeon]
MTLSTTATVTIVAADLVSAVLLLYIALRLLRALSLIGSVIDPALGMTLLALSQLAAALTVVVEEQTLTYTLYTLTGPLLAGGFFLIATPQKPAQPRAREHALLIPPALLVAAIGDLVGLLAGVLSALRYRGVARVVSLLVVVGFALRIAGLSLLPSPPGVLSLVLGEVVRSSALVVLSLAYAPVRG